MKIGLTYDLRAEYLKQGYSEEETAEFDRLDTIESIESALGSLGHQTVRIGHARQLVERLARGERWELVFNICEGLRGLAREAQVPAILDVYDIPYTFSSPAVLCICLDKSVTKSVLHAAGVPVTASYVVRRIEDLLLIPGEFPLFAKPVAERTGKGISPASRARDWEELSGVCAALLRRYNQPVIVEPYLPGREFTVGIWGSGQESQAIGTLEILLRDGAEPLAYSYRNKEQCEELVEYRLVSASRDRTVAAAERLALAAWQALGCQDAGRIDLRCDSRGKPQILEVNPLAGLHPLHSDLPMLCTAVGIAYERLIERIVESACCRIESRDGEMRDANGTVFEQQTCT